MTVKRYEGLFILNTAELEEGINAALERIKTEIHSLGGKIENVQKMDRRPFARVTAKQRTSGVYANILFDAPVEVAEKLKTHFRLNDEVYRVMITKAPVPKKAAAK